MSDKLPLNLFLNDSPSPKKRPLTSEEGIDTILTEGTKQDGFSLDSDFTPDECEALTSEISLKLKNSISSQKYQTYFENGLQVTGIQGNTMKIRLKTAFIVNMVKKHYLKQIESIIHELLGSPYKVIIESGTGNSETSSVTDSSHSKVSSKYKSPADVSFTLDLTPSKEDLMDKVESKYLTHMEGKTTGIEIEIDKTFKRFIIGPSNNLACATTKAVAQNPGKSGKYPCLYLYSSSGLGKTHLLHAVANQIREDHPALTLCLITAREFMNEMIFAIQNNRITDFRKKYSESIDVLMIDDIHELKDKQGTQNEFFHIFNQLHHKGKQLIFTSDKPPQEILGIEERIKTRLQWGLVIDIQKPDLETRLAILNNKAKELDLFVSDDVLNLISAHIRSSIRELEGALIKLSAFSDVMKVELDAEMVKDLLLIRNEDGDKSEIGLERIARATAQHFKIPLPDLRSKARNKTITRARHLSMYLSQKLAQATLAEIGIFFGGRDHTSVLHGVKKIKDSLKDDQELSKDLGQIENMISL